MSKAREGQALRLIQRLHSLDRRSGVLSHTVWILGQWGFHASLIGAVTGLSVGQVYSRLKAYGVRLRDYRDGKNEFAGKVIERVPVVRYRMKAVRGARYRITYK